MGKETIGTTALGRRIPDMILEMPDDSFAPVLLALGIAGVFAGLIMKAWPVTAVAAVVLAVALVWWLWPRRDLREREAAHG